MDGKRRCITCHDLKDPSDFYKLTSGRWGIGSRCKECMDALAGTSRAKGKKCRACSGRMPVGPAVMHADCQFVGDQRRCLKCVELKSLDSFSNDKRRADGKYPWCKPCQNTYMVGRKFQHHDQPLNGRDCPLCDTPVRGTANRKFCSNYCKDRVRTLTRNFRLSAEHYRALVDATAGKCPICRKPTSDWHVDHDHSTGRVMGVVCVACNVGALARTFHDIEFVKRLLSYLENPPTAQAGVEAFAPQERHGRPNIHKMWQHGS